MRKADSKPVVTFAKEQEADMATRLQSYLEEEFDCELSGLQSKFLLRHITDTLGKYYYNQGIEDAVALMSQRVEDLYVLMRDD